MDKCWMLDAAKWMDYMLDTDYSRIDGLGVGC